MIVTKPVFLDSYPHIKRCFKHLFLDVSVAGWLDPRLPISDLSRFQRPRWRCPASKWWRRFWRSWITSHLATTKWWAFQGEIWGKWWKIWGKWWVLIWVLICFPCIVFDVYFTSSLMVLSSKMVDWTRKNGDHTRISWEYMANTWVCYGDENHVDSWGCGIYMGIFQESLSSIFFWRLAYNLSSEPSD